jgi:hypothetical protein
MAESIAQWLGKLGFGRSAFLLGEMVARRQLSEYDRAEALYRRALARAEKLVRRPLVAHCHVGLGKLYGTVGRRAEAGAELTVARDLYQTIEIAYWLPPAEATPAPASGY